MLMPEFRPSDVISSYDTTAQTRLVEAVVPNVTDAPVDPQDLRSFVEFMNDGDTTGRFTKKGLVIEKPRNYLEGIDFTFTCDTVHAEVPSNTSAHVEMVARDAMPELLAPVDAHFREWAGILGDTATKPLVSVLSGEYKGSFAETALHFDYKATRPQVSYKMYFQGDAEHSSVYYPGLYRFPTKLTQFARSFGGVNPDTVKRLSPTQKHIMPAHVVCMEPWNAYHGGPSVPEARGTQRGIMAVSYDLSKLNIAKNPAN